MLRNLLIGAGTMTLCLFLQSTVLAALMATFQNAISGVKQARRGAVE